MSGRAGATFLFAIGMAMGCERENRRYDDHPRAAVTAQVSQLQPGPAVTLKSEEGVYDDNAWGTSEGKRLYSWMNCSGCHANGGGGMGPALMDDQWVYGEKPEQIYRTIVDGRPNGMPAWHDRLTEQQVWELVAYVRSMSGLTPKGARPARDDHMMMKAAEEQTPNAKPKQTTVPKPPPGE